MNRFRIIGSGMFVERGQAREVGAMEKSYQAWSCAQNGQPPAEVYQQSFGRQMMGWIITRANLTAAVSNDHEFCERLNRMEGLIEALIKKDFWYWFSDWHDQGYIECGEEDWEYIKETCEALGLKQPLSDDGDK